LLTDKLQAATSNRFRIFLFFAVGLVVLAIGSGLVMQRVSYNAMVNRCDSDPNVPLSYCECVADGTMDILPFVGSIPFLGNMLISATEEEALQQSIQQEVIPMCLRTAAG
jgi:hypothetical protein